MKAAKAVAAAVGTLVTAFIAIIADDVITVPELGTIAQVAIVAVGGVLTTLGVWKVTNAPE